MSEDINSRKKFSLHIKVWFFSYLGLVATGLIFPFEILYPMVIENQLMMQYIQEHISAAMKISAKTKFPEFAFVYIVWVALFSAPYLIWTLFTPYITPRKNLVFTKRRMVFLLIGIPIFIVGLIWTVTQGSGGGLEGGRGDFWVYLYSNKGVFSIVIALFWFFAIFGFWGFRQLLLTTIKKDIEIR